LSSAEEGKASLSSLGEILPLERIEKEVSRQQNAPKDIKEGTKKERVSMDEMDIFSDTNP